MSPSPRATHRSPKRRPLHERSDSQSNEVAAPNARLLQEKESWRYSRNPYPIHSSQVLTPTGSYAPVFDDEDTFYHHDVHRVFPTKEEEEASAPAPLRIQKKTKEEFHTSSASESELPSLYSSADFSGFTLPSSPPMSQSLQQREWTIWKEQSEGSRVSSGAIDGAVRDLMNMPSPSRFPAAHPTMRRLSSNPSNVSIASSASSDTLEPRLHTGSSNRRPTSAYRYSSLLPPIQTSPAGSRASLDGAQDAAQSYPDSPGPQSPVSVSPEDRLSISEPHASSHASFHAVVENSPQVQYPVVQPPAASASWADNSITIPKRNAGLYQSYAGRLHQWTPRSSGFVPPEVEQSQESDEKGKQPIRAARPNSRRDTTDSTIRVVNERNSARIPKRQRQSRPGTAGLASIPSVTSPPSSRGNPQVRPSSRSSFLIYGIPQWARIYYSRYGRDGSLPNTPVHGQPIIEGTFPIPDAQEGGQPRSHVTGGMGGRTSHIPDPMLQRDEIRIDGSPQSDTWTPHLQPDKQAGMRKSYWKAPSFASRKDRRKTNRRNVELAAFCIGFIFPLAWVVGAFLPLPACRTPEMQGAEESPDVEAAITESTDSELYRNARWWRNVNRGMSVIGLLIIAAIIALAVVGVHA
ncbi:hypothetical protein L228DRAFT_269681 [Xylona heveae TC161]|uniref:Serine-rich protein n=1 Tax=Xylona heveae (strain CBS 132557 / TC161) TaxID=1328760 RepID=A0A165FRP0_XYLHT|nr:hypothetical protein L228DRAFT_269681 [Xylona heveae TC161]KZF21296.1 hypothetical protein L228DRAFT_269681 [Xylona heveae TC161]